MRCATKLCLNCCKYKVAKMNLDECHLRNIYRIWDIKINTMHLMLKSKHINEDLTQTVHGRMKKACIDAPCWF